MAEWLALPNTAQGDSGSIPAEDRTFFLKELCLEQ